VTGLDLLLITKKAIETTVRELECEWKKDPGSTLCVNGKTLAHDKIRTLLRWATNARNNSYAPYSHFNVGAAILAGNLAGDLTIVDGSNVENAAYSPTLCAECAAAAKAVNEGFRRFHACAVVGGLDSSMSEGARKAAAGEYVTPCGRCRQVLNEFESDSSCMIIVAKDSGEVLLTTLDCLLPAGFGPANLGIDPLLYKP
jgi:cytidine deaminase